MYTYHMDIYIYIYIIEMYISNQKPVGSSRPSRRRGAVSTARLGHPNLIK